VANEKITNVETMTESFMEPQLASIMTPQMVEVLNLIEHSLQFISEIKAKRNW
jgi:hypothetical protein